ncbi:MAG: ATP-binding protein [Pseudomonadota bacterium]
MAPDRLDPIQTTDQPGLKQRLGWLIAFRIVFASVLVIATLVWRPGEGGMPFLALLFATSAHLAMAILFVVMDRIEAIRWTRTFALLQIVWDLIFTTSLVAVTGGLDSDLKGLYWLTIAIAAILLFRFGAFLAALLSGLLYGVLLNLELFGLVVPLFNVVAESSIWKEDRIWHSIILQTAGFFTVAYVFSTISVRLRRAETMLVERNADLEDLEALMGRIVESIASGLATLDAKGRVRFWSRTAEEITGLTQEEVRGKALNAVFPEARELAGGGEERMPSAPRSKRLEVPFRGKASKPRILGFSLSPLRHGAGGEPGMLLLFEDLTDFREMEEQVKRADRLAAVGELAARIAHEIRNPLTSVSGSIEVLKASLKLNERDRRLMEIVVRETDRLNQLLTDFLQFARPTTIQAEEVELDRLVRETVELFSRSHGGESLKVRLELAPGAVVEGDPRQLNQMFWNLIKNASEAMPNGGEIRVALENDSDPSHVSIEVHDSGAGIPREILERIFTPFFTTKKRGTGLGLAMVRRIAQEHGGEVFVESSMDCGTTFRVRLPRAQARATTKGA